MMTIKDYKFLCNLEEFLDILRSHLYEENNNYANMYINSIDKYLFQLRNLIKKLEESEQ